MSTRRMLIVTACLVFALLVSGCAKQPAPTTTPEAPIPSGAASLESPPAEAASASSEVTKGTKGTPATLGIWTVTVRESEFGSGSGGSGKSGQGGEGNEDSAKSGLKVEIDLRNNGGGALAVSSSDWSAVSATGRIYSVVPSARPDKQGERNVPAGRTEDLTVSFDVLAGGSYVLRFAPAYGGPGVLEIPLQ